MALRIKRAVPGRFVKGRFVPNPKGETYRVGVFGPFKRLSQARKKAQQLADYYKRDVDVHSDKKGHAILTAKPSKNPKSKTEKALYKVIRKSGYSRRESKRLAKLNLPYFQTKPSSANPMKVAVTMIKTFHPPRGGVMLSGHRYYVRPKDAEELKKRGLARITHEGKRKRNPVKTKMVKRGAHWFAEMSSGAGTSSARYDTKAEAKKAAAEYRRIHKTGRL